MKIRNVWPLGIVAAFVFFIAGTAALIVIACSNRNELVTVDYYEQEIRFQQQMDRAERTRQLPIGGTVGYDAGSRSIVISLPPEHYANAGGQIELYRPSDAGLDQRLDLRTNASGTQTIDARRLRNGLWRVKVSWTTGGQDYSLEARVIVGVEEA